MRKPALITAYLALSAIAAPLWAPALYLRARNAKEDSARLSEKSGHASKPRANGTLVWMHSVRVGESAALLTLIERLSDARPDVSVLLTTITLASAQSLEKRKLPDGVIHQFLPVDTPSAVRRFLNHWCPYLTVIAEADWWPRLLIATKKRGCPMVLLNTHLTPRRYRRRKRNPQANGWLMDIFDLIHVQDQRSFDLYRDLGAPMDKMTVTGVLKAASNPLPDLPDARAVLEAQIGPRPRCLAASTKAQEEPQLFDAHVRALETLPDSLLLIATRQVRDTDKTEASALARFAPNQIARRSRGDAITAATRVFIADTIGEMGLWYRLAPMAYRGQSLPVEERILGGKNPFEAESLGCMILHGPNMATFRKAYDRLHDAGGALEVTDSTAMAQAVVQPQDPTFRALFITGATAVQAQNMQPLDMALDALLTYLQTAGRWSAPFRHTPCF
jgi:3-deoxy-D-manno-octulosonic-acid transferase